MVTLTRITKSDSPFLPELLSLYTEAFPPSERRNEGQLKKLIEESEEMYFNVVLFKKKAVGLFIYWDLNDFFFLEHLAISTSARNDKIGQQVLSWIAKNLNGLRLMEVEPIESNEFAARRISYYERNGYRILDKNYRQPSYSDRTKHYPLWIMGNQDTPTLTECIAKIITEVYTKHYV